MSSNIHNQEKRINNLQKKAKKVCRLLEKIYPITFLGNKKNPLDEYLYITLSLRTHASGYEKAYKSFKAEFTEWSDALKATESQIAKAIEPGGLANQKSRRIKDALHRIYSEFGEVSLRALKHIPQDAVESFLLSLPGIGLKSARCIMMYSLGFNVLPVDTHVTRIARRIGLIPNVDNNKTHKLLEALIPPQLRFNFHVTCVQHGRQICRGQYPKCKDCCLLNICSTT